MFSEMGVNVVETEEASEEEGGEREWQLETYAIAKADLLLKGEGEAADLFSREPPGFRRVV